MHIKFGRSARQVLPPVMAAMGLALSLVPTRGAAQDQFGSNSGCQLAQIAFCDTFDSPSPLGDGTRSGDLDGVLWGVSRSSSDDNPSQHNYVNWNASQLTRCGTTVTVAPPRDVQICNGKLVESINDQGAATVLALYPRQPFDFAGRTGKVVFDVTNDTQGSHMAWPEFVVTDQPVPAPFEDASGIANFARNSFGIQFSTDCRDGRAVIDGEGDSWSVNSMFTTTNYRFSGQKFTMMGCVKKSPGADGPMNHVEIDISPTHVDVFATDPGSSALKQIAAADIAMPLTRGLVWMEEAHYNANKGPGNQGNHTFAWDNFGFDGPILPRDLGFDVLDAVHDGRSGGSIGFLAPAGGALSLQVHNVHDIEHSSAALLEFTWWPHRQASITYSTNGNQPHKMDWPYGDAPVYKSHTLAVPVPLNELLNGTNTFSLSSTDTDLGGVSIANVDLILVGAGGMPGGPAPAVPAAPAPAPPLPVPAVEAPPAPEPPPAPEMPPPLDIPASPDGSTPDAAVSDD